jgi:hypothetical protein
VQELKFLQKALKEVGIDPRKNVSVSGFISGIIDEVNSLGYDEFCRLVPPYAGEEVSNRFIIDAISSPAFSAMYQIKENYTSSSRVIRSLQRRLELSHSDAIKFVLTDFIAETGIEMGAELPLKDLATEILACFSLAQRLSAERLDGHSENPPEPTVVALPHEEPEVISTLLAPNEARLAAAKEYLGAQPAVSGFYKMEAIPEKKLRNAKVSMEIPADETVVCLIDATLFGSSSEGAAIGVGGVYWKSLWTKPGRVSWEDVSKYKESIFAKGSKDLMLWDRGLINLSGSDVTAPWLKEMLIAFSTQFEKFT